MGALTDYDARASQKFPASGNSASVSGFPNGSMPPQILDGTGMKRRIPINRWFPSSEWIAGGGLKVRLPCHLSLALSMVPEIVE
jgi:hypothetical protein